MVSDKAIGEVARLEGERYGARLEQSRVIEILEKYTKMVQIMGNEEMLRLLVSIEDEVRGP